MSDDPVPAYFSFRYVLWFMWSHAITLLMTVQVIFSALTIDPNAFSHTTFHWLLIINSVLVAVLAQIRRDNPPPYKPDPKENLK
jgi:hypothetical protein